MLFIGIDLGTSSVKLLLMKSGGEILRTVTEEYPVYFPQSGWSEQDPEEWFNGTVKGIKKLLDGFDGKEVGGISFGGQMHGLTPLDKDGNVIRRAILWNDGRSEEESQYLNNVIGKKKLSEYTGNISFAGFTAPKVLWMKKNEPENFAKIDKILLPKDYLAYRLSGVFATDVSDASGTLYFDCANRKWSAEMLEILGITEAQLPKVYESYEAIGKILPEIADQLGINPDCLIVAGAGDNAAAAVGTGTVGNGGCNISLGTSGTIFIASSNFKNDEENSLHAFDHADGGYHLMGCMLSAASCNKWWMEDIIGTKDFAAEQTGITTLGENNIFFLPYLMGERSPLNNPECRAMFIGMSMDTKREEMTQAVLEGVAFALRDSFECAKKMGLDIKSSNICGGGAKSPLWRKIVANVLGIELTRTQNDEGPALGGAILAAVACGEYKNVEEACKAIVTTHVAETPDPELTAKYEAKYQRFSKLYPMCKEAGLW